MHDIVGILLAGGASRRFGGNKLKQLLPNGEAVAVCACRHLLAACDRVVVVLSAENQDLATALSELGAKCLICPDAELGMGHSLRFGIANTENAQGWLIALADMPWIAPTTLAQLAKALKQGTQLVAPSYQQQRGHPVGFCQKFRAELLELSGDQGAKALLNLYAADLQLLETNDPAILWDIDFKADLNKHP